MPCARLHHTTEFAFWTMSPSTPRLVLHLASHEDLKNRYVRHSRIYQKSYRLTQVCLPGFGKRGEMSEIRTIVRSRSWDPQNKSQNRSPQGNSQLIAPFLMTLLAPLTSCITDSLHRTTHLTTGRPRIVSSVLQSVSDESDFFLAAGANSSLLCTLIEIR